MPAAYVRLESLPLTPNGKLDRKALPAPDEDAYATQMYEAPQGEMERKLAEIWAEVLKLEKVGRHDNFFALGGHSLLAVTLIERMRRTDLKSTCGSYSPRLRWPRWLKPSSAMRRWCRRPTTKFLITAKPSRRRCCRWCG